MKLIAFLLVTAGLAIMPAAGQKASTKQQLTIPPDAKKVEPNTYRHTDAQGRHWIYRETPFGVVRFEETPSAKQEKVEGLPEGAEQTAPNTYRYTGKDGVAWIYRKTPFGLQKYEEKSALPPEKTTTVELDNIKAREDGDSIRFEKPSPFGPYKWVRKKNDLTDIEKQVWDREQKKKQTGSETAKQE